MLKKKSSLRHTGAFWAFVAPCCILFGIFFLLPLVLSIAFSFTNYDGWKVMDFVGIKNYITLFKDSKFYASMGRTLVYTICCLPFRVIIPLLIAVLVTSPRVRLKSLSRTMIYIPVLMSALVVGITINWMFSQEYGLINFIIQSFGGTPLEWSLNSGLATFVIGFASVWASIGFNMIIYVGGINNISPDLYEAASIDGANSWQTLWKVTMPLSIPGIVSGITMVFMPSVTTFFIPRVLGGGNTMMFGDLIEAKFLTEGNWNVGSALSLIMMVLILISLSILRKADPNGEGGGIA